ncbi:MAG: acylphosphatase [Candidatus Micrarchaeia archaeon]
MRTLVLIVHGFVQGVGFRAYVKGIADKNNISGNVRNLEDGSVMVIAQGDKENMKKFLRSLRVKRVFGPDVFEIEKEEKEMDGIDGFAVL